MKVFVHIDANGTYVGNGGVLLLTDLANKLADMGYDVGVFDHRNGLKWRSFDWLCLEEIKFKIAKYSSVRATCPKNYRLVSAWLKALPYSLRNESLRYLESSELIRESGRDERKYIYRHNVKVANLHPTLTKYYEELGVSDMIDFPVWVDDRAKNEMLKNRNTVGVQLVKQKRRGLLGKLKIFEKWEKQRYEPLLSKFAPEIIFCNGSYGHVLMKMKCADFYFHVPSYHPLITSFMGETMGRPLVEAMGCGCVCLTFRHPGISFLKENVVYVHSIKDAIQKIEYLQEETEAKEVARKRSLTFIEENMRWNRQHERIVKKWLD